MGKSDTSVLVIAAVVSAPVVPPSLASTSIVVVGVLGTRRGLSLAVPGAGQVVRFMAF